MKTRINKIIDLLTTINIGAIFFLVPIFFGYFPKITNAFELAKMSLFMILVCLLLFFTIIKLIFFSQGLIKRAQIIAREYKIFIILLLYYFITLLLSTIFSIDPGLSLFGFYYRLEGLVSHIFYILFFLLLLINLSTKEKIRHILLMAVIASVFISVYGLLQSIGLDWIIWNESTSIRATSTLGQPNHLGSYLLFIIPLIGYFIISYKNIIAKLFFMALLIVQLLVIYNTFSLSSWLGLVIALPLTAIILLLNNRTALSNYFKKIFSRVGGSRFGYLILHISIVIIALAGVWLFYSYDFSVLTARADNVFNFRSGSTAARVQFWSAAWQAIRQKPIIGYGLDAQREVLSNYYEPNWAVYSNVNVRPSRAHNIWLDTWLTQGVLGLLAYLALLYLFFSIIIKNIRQNNEVLLNYTILFALISYLVYLQFNYHHLSALIFFWLFFVIILRLDQLKYNFVYSKEEKNIGKNKKLYIFKSLAVIIASVLLIFGIKYSTAIYTNDHYFFEFRNSFSLKSYLAAIEVDKYMDRQGIYYRHYDSEMALIYAQWIKSIEADNIIQVGLDRLKNILPGLSGQTAGEQYARAQAYTALAREDPANYVLAENEFIKLASKSPHLPKYHRESGRLYFLEGKYGQAIREFSLALDSVPPLDDPYMNKEHAIEVRQEMAMNYEGLYRSHEKLGNNEQAEYYNNLFQNITKQ